MTKWILANSHPDHAQTHRYDPVVFQGGCSSQKQYNFGDYASFYFVGDGVDDTPAHAGPTWDITSHSTCWVDDKLDTCPNMEGYDPVNNYLGKSWEMILMRLAAN